MRWLTLIFVTLFTLPLAAQNVPSSLKVGVLLPFSGPYKTLGYNVLQSLELAAAETGVTLVVRDSADEKSSVAATVKKLATVDQVDLIVGPIGSKVSLAAAESAHKQKVPLFVLGSDESVNRKSAWVFRVRSSPQEQARKMAAVAFRDLDQKRAAVLFPKTEYGERATKAFVERFTALGGVVTAIGQYAPETTDFNDPLKELVGRSTFVGKKKKVGKKRANRFGYVSIRSKKTIDFDLLFIPDFSHRVARLLPFLPLVGIQNGEGGDGVAVQLLGLSGWQGKTMEFGGSTAAGALYLDTFAGDSDGGRAEEFVRTFENAVGRLPEDVDAEAFDLLWMLGKLGQGVRDKTIAKRRLAVVSKLPYRNPWGGVTGDFLFGPDGAPLREFNIYRFDSNGEVSPAF